MSLSTHLGTPESEPLRRNGYVLVLLVAIGTVCTALGVADPITPQVVLTGIGAALAEAVVLLLGIARVHDKVYSPERVKQLVGPTLSADPDDVEDRLSWGYDESGTPVAEWPGEDPPPQLEELPETTAEMPEDIRRMLGNDA